MKRRARSKKADLVDRKADPSPYEMKNLTVESNEKGLPCWHCAHYFPNKPYQMPIDYNELTGQFKGIGNFCSLPGIKRYIIDTAHAHRGRLLMLLTDYARSEHGVFCDIPVGPRMYEYKNFIAKDKRATEGYDFEEWLPKCMETPGRLRVYPFVPDGAAIETYSGVTVMPSAVTEEAGPTVMEDDLESCKN